MDIGQGDGLVVISPDGFVTLVDSGNESEASIVSSYLASLGITDIDYTVTSHLHADHFGATDVLLQQFPGVVACFDSGGTYSSTQYSQYDATAGARRVAVGPGNTIDMGPSVQVDVLHGHAGSTNENDNSVVLRITHGMQTFLLGGDCESECESQFDPGHIEVYKAHHHGSATSSSDLLLSRMNPTTAIVSLGSGNTYGHPHQETLDALAAYGVDVHRTDLEGPLVVRSDGADHVVNGELGCTDGQTRSCGLTDVGECQLGTQTCSGNTWGTCIGEISPAAEDCGNGRDDDCDGSIDAADCDCGGCTGHVLISQVYYDTIGTDSIEEFVDLYNPMASAVDLTGWSLADNAGTWTLPPGTTIGAGAYLTIARDQAGFSALFGFDPDVTGMTLSLNNTGDKLDLVDNTAALQDHVAWESFEAGWSVAAGTGASIERVDLSNDTDTVNDWGVTSPASPRGGPSTCTSDSDCDDGLYCNGMETCDPQNGCQAGTPVACADGISCTVDACDEATDSCVFTANNSACDNGLYCDGAEVCDPSLGCQPGNAVSCSGDACNTGVCNESLDSCDYQPVADGTVCDNLDGCTGDTCQAGTCQPAVCTGGPSLVIAQVSYDTPGTDSKEEFIEIYNPTGATVDLSGWTLQDNVGSWSFPSGTNLASGRTLIVAADNRGFRKLYGFNPDLNGLSLALGNSGDIVRLVDNAGAEVDMVAWENFVSGWSIAAGTGDSIERLDLASDTDTVNDWVVRSPSSPLAL